jgi:hypothetical protein
MSGDGRPARPGTGPPPRSARGPRSTGPRSPRPHIRLDPDGRRALFEMPVSAPRDALRQGPTREGREALFSSGRREFGTVVVDCDACGARARVSAPDLAVRMVTGSVWLPLKRYGHYLRCPTCAHRTWCRIGWTG